MKIVERNSGKKIGFELNGTTLQFADGALALDLARYQQDDAVTRDIMVEGDGFLTMGRGRYYAAQVEIPARQYEETAAPNSEMSGTAEDEAGGESMSRETVIRTAVPLNTDDVILYLFAIDGITIR